MNHEWPTAVHKTMIAVDKVTPEAPDLSLITLRPMPKRRPAVFTVAVAVLAVLATVGGLAYLLGRDQRDTTPPAATGGQTTVPTSAQQNEACALLSDPPLSPAEQASMIDRLLTSDPAALDPAELQKCKTATMVQLRRLQAIVLERQAALHPSSTSSTQGSTISTPSTSTDVGSNTFVVPTGNVRVGSGDMFLVHADGDLWLHPGLLVGRPGTPVRLADMSDPRVPVAEGPGPNTIEDVAGEVGGAVYFSDCCEPIAGDVRAATGPDTVTHLGAGISLVLSPDRTRLASSNSFGLTVWDLKTGRFRYRDLNNSAAQPINPWDLTWTVDGRRLIVLYLDEKGASLLPYSANDELTPGTAVRLDTNFTPVQPPGVQFCGHGPNGELAIAYYGKDRTIIKFYDPSTLIEKPAIQRELPTGVTSVQLASDGTGLLWIDNSTIWSQPTTGTIRRLGDGYTAAWFAT